MSYLQGMRKSSTTLWWILVFCILHMIKVDNYSNVYLYTYVNDYIWIQLFIFIHIVTYIFIIEIICVLLDFTNQNIYEVVYRRFLARVCCERTWFLVLNERCNPGCDTHNSLILLHHKNGFISLKANFALTAKEACKFSVTGSEPLRTLNSSQKAFRIFAAKLSRAAPTHPAATLYSWHACRQKFCWTVVKPAKTPQWSPLSEGSWSLH